MIYELIQKYQPSHYIIIGGDLNEDLTNSVQDNRKQYLIEFIDECNLKWTSDRKTFINVNGIDCSETDYFLIDNRNTACSQSRGKRHNMSYHCYGHDTQAYLVIKPIDNWINIATRMEAYLSDISAWMKSNMLKTRLNW